MRKYKTYLLFFHQSSYQLDTSYKYVSLLIVGRGGNGKDTDNAPNVPEWYGGCMGGNSGVVAYRKNIPIDAKGVNGMAGFYEINFSYNYRYDNSTFPGLLVRYLESLGRTIVAFLGNASNGQDHRTNDYYVFTINDESNYDLFYYGWNEGGLATSDKVSGAGGSYADGVTTTTGSGTQSGGEGGDGRFGHQGPDYNSGTSAAATIPLQSIFGGTGEGAGSYYTSSSNCKAGGGGGYGDGNMNGRAGYGAGGTAYKTSSYSTDLYDEGDGIVCLYYHNNLL